MRKIKEIWCQEDIHFTGTAYMPQFVLELGWFAMEHDLDTKNSWHYAG